MSVGFVAVLLYVCYQAQLKAAYLVQNGFELYSEANFWIINLFGFACYVATMVLLYLAAAAMITFPTENRSTPLRIAMLGLQTAFLSGIAWYWKDRGFDSEVIWRLILAAVGYWFVMGTMLNGEQSELSRRVARSLPTSTLGRVFFTWFQPGPSSGYMFAVANLSAIALILLGPTLYSLFMRGPGAVWPNPDRFLTILALAWSYGVAYLGLGCLVVAMLRKVSEVTMFASVLLHLLLVLAGSGIPTSLHWMSAELQTEPYSYLQAFNPFWTLEYIHDFSPTPEESVLLVVVPAAAICVLLVNLPGIVRELARVRTELPLRVAKDEEELHPPPAAVPQNPWEADEGS
jgi:hypothetical protein